MFTKKQDTIPDTTRLTEDEVFDRTKKIEDETVISELYDFGLNLRKEVLDRIRSLESKAVTFAGYGAAVVSLLLVNSAKWTVPQSEWCIWSAIGAGFYAFLSAWFAIQVLTLRRSEGVSEDEWLKEDALSDLTTLKRYRIRMIWSDFSSRTDIQKSKARELQRSESCLAASALYLLVLVLVVCFIHTNLPIQGWAMCWLRRGWRASFFASALFFGWRTWRVRLV